MSDICVVVVVVVVDAWAFWGFHYSIHHLASLHNLTSEGVFPEFQNCAIWKVILIHYGVTFLA